MFSHTQQIRVRYGETDKMGYVYYGNYALYYEIGRVELLRSQGIEYSKLEKLNIGLPVIEYEIKFLKPAFYDDVITIETSINQKPTSKITFTYQSFNEKNELINRGKVTLVFINLKTGKPIKCPENINRLFNKTD